MAGPKVRRAGAVVAAILALAILGSVGTVVVLRVRKRERVAACADNLRALLRAEMVNLSMTGRRGALPDHPLGTPFWEQVRKTVPGLDAHLACPARRGPISGGIDYWGPSEKLSRLQGNGPVGCDAPGNHGRGGGNVLLKSGDVVESDGELWERCMKGACRP